MQTSETIHPEHAGDASHVAQVLNIGHVVDCHVEDGVVWLNCDQGRIAVLFPSDSVLRFKVSTSEPVDLKTTVAVLSGMPHVVPSTLRQSDRLVLRTERLHTTIYFQPFSMEVCTSQGQPVYQLASLTTVPEGGWVCQSVPGADAHFYGLGEKTGYLDKRGESYTMWNSDVYDPHVPEIEALYVSIPFVIQWARGVATGVFIDNPGRTRFDMRTHADHLNIWAATGDFDAYVISGPMVKDVVGRYTALTGRIELPPKWAIGYHQSRYSYMNQDEVVGLAQTFRAKDIPLDAIYLDIHYMDGYRVFTFDKQRFPKPAEMTHQLAELGVRLITIVDPGVKQDPAFSVYRAGITGDYFCKRIEGDVFIGDVWPGKSAFPDFTDDATAKWWGENHQFYLDHGVSGIWNDMNEPAVFNETKTMDTDVVHRNNGEIRTHGELHNLYGLLMSKATYEGLKEKMDGTRPFVLTRAGYAGVQRYAAIWTGDNRSFWEHLAMAIPMMLNLGLSGVPFAGADIGGFAHHASGELLARWTQMGVFTPFFRNHSALDTHRQEPWSFGSDIEDICRRYIQLRYQWLPHFYSLFRETAETGLPWMRPLLMEFPDDEQVYRLSDQFMVGDSVMAAPVYRPDTLQRAVYLPRGNWYNYWTGQTYEGGQHILADAPLETIPLFVKAGAILPEQPVVSHASAEPQGPCTLNVYLGQFHGTSSYRLYDDDGETFAYRQDEYSLLDVQLKRDESHAELLVSELHRGYSKSQGAWMVWFKGVPTKPQQVTGMTEVGLAEIGQVEHAWAYDHDCGEVVVSIGTLAGTRIQIDL